MRTLRQINRWALAATVALVLMQARVISASVRVQCPGDTDGDGIIDTPDPAHPQAKCIHLTAGDGYVKMADGKPLYVFGFADITGTPPGSAIDAGTLAASFPAPTLVQDEGDEYFLTLTNVGMLMRPDLSDPHTVHYHGFPNAAPVFDGVPESAVSVNMGASLTFYYHVVEPGTYMYHCHVEATEHMQMGMLGNLYVRPRQNRLPDGTSLSGFVHHTGYQYAYNDGDGSTRYDVEYPLQLGSFDSTFHDLHEAVQPLPFALMQDDYGLINGRGYPDTLVAGSLPSLGDMTLNKTTQNTTSLLRATVGQKVLLRISSLSITRFFTVAVLGLPMKVVGHNARLLRSGDGTTLFYDTTSVTLGGGESVDVVIDTTGAAPGTYPVYTTNLNYLTNRDEDFGGMMTEIRVDAP